LADNNRIVTFAQYEAKSNQVAHLLRSLGLNRGDRIAIYMENNAEYLILAWGALRTGLRVTAIATHLSPGEIDYILSDSGALVLFTSEAMAESATELKAEGIRNNCRFMLGGVAPDFANLEAALDRQPSEPVSEQSEGIEMLYSSGTTGRPKAVRKPLPELPFGQPPPSYQSFADIYGVDENTIYFHPSPLYHAAPLLGHLRVIRFGGCCVITRKFDAERALTLMDQHHVTHTQWVPTHFVRLLRLPPEVRENFEGVHHGVAIHAAAPCPVEIKQQMLDWWGPIIFEYYGGSEGNGYVAITAAEWLKKKGSVGRAKVGRLRVCDEQGDEVPIGVEGTVFFEDGLKFAYHNDPEKTATAYNNHGWSTLGDIGYVDQDGYLFLTDRKAFVIVSGGVNIYPQEAENLLSSHPDIIDVAVFGIPDPEYGEQVKAVVQPVRMDLANKDLERRLLDFCRQHLSNVKCPRSIDFREDLPRQDNGKLYKQKLRDQYWSQYNEGIKS
ncbi:MAG: acyl-CoA synthetase, partial [Pseudomonadota bacterium]